MMYIIIAPFALRTIHDGLARSAPLVQQQPPAALPWSIMIMQQGRAGPAGMAYVASIMLGWMDGAMAGAEQTTDRARDRACVCAWFVDET